MAKPIFHSLTISHLEAFGDTALAVRFAVPAELRDHYNFVPGQYLTLRASIGGVDTRRPYSICTTPDDLGADGEIGVGIKRVEMGAFSSHAVAHFALGDKIDVMTPQGRFAFHGSGIDGDLLLLAAGSGITPILSIARMALAEDASRTVTLVYGNRDSASIMFRTAVENLKDCYLDRFRLLHVLSREARDIDLLNGRIDSDKIAMLMRAGVVAPATTGAVFICGPDSMITDCENRLTDAGIAPDKIFYERFTPVGGVAASPAVPKVAATSTATSACSVTVMLDGVQQTIAIDPATETVLDAGQKAGLEMPYSCTAGMCCTCRCKVTDGAVEMDANYSLEPWELEAGFVLSCQARPVGKTVAIDFDAQ